MVVIPAEDDILAIMAQLYPSPCGEGFYHIIVWHDRLFCGIKKGGFHIAK